MRKKLLQRRESFLHFPRVRKRKAKIDLGDSQLASLNTDSNYVSASSVQIK